MSIFFDTYGKGESCSWPAYVNIDDERNLLISTHKDDTEVTVSVEPLPVRYMYDETSKNFTIPHSGDAVLIKWHPYSSGSYQIDARADAQVQYIEYGSNLDETIELIRDYNYETSWIAERYQDRYLYVEALSDNTNVSFDVSKETRQLEVGTSYRSILSYGESETFPFTAEKDGTYIFYSKGSSDLSADIKVPGSNARSVAVYGNSKNNNFYITQYFNAGEQAEITVRKNSDDSYDFWLYTYMLHDQTEEKIDKDTSFNKNINLEANQEEWFLFTVKESGYYEFLSNSNNTYMELYNYDTMEVLGQSHGSDSIKAGLSEGTRVWLRTWYNYHSSGSYDVTVQQGALKPYQASQTLQYFDMNLSIYTYANSSFQQTEISYEYNNKFFDESSARLKFSTQNKYDDLHLALYLGSDTEPVAEGINELEYVVDSENFNSMKLVVWRDAYKEFDEYVYCSVEELEYANITLDSSKSLYIPQNGSATVIYPEVSKAGKYVFYSTDNVSATVYKNDTELTLDNESLSDTGFQYTLDLAENDIIKFIFNTDDGESLSISLYGYEVTEDLASAELPTTNLPVAVSKEHTIKTITFKNNSKGKYVFKLVPSESYENCEFELTVNGKTYTAWNTATEEFDLEENAEVTLKLWNTDRYQEASATLNVTYTAAETDPENPGESGDNSDGSDKSNNTNE